MGQHKHNPTAIAAKEGKIQPKPKPMIPGIPGRRCPPLYYLRPKDTSLEDCAEQMNRSLDSVKQLSQKVNKKIQKEM